MNSLPAIANWHLIEVELRNINQYEEGVPALNSKLQRSQYTENSKILSVSSALIVISAKENSLKNCQTALVSISLYVIVHAVKKPLHYKKVSPVVLFDIFTFDKSTICKALHTSWTIPTLVSWIRTALEERICAKRLLGGHQGEVRLIPLMVPTVFWSV